jgi:hypothetical protein
LASISVIPTHATSGSVQATDGISLASKTLFSHFGRDLGLVDRLAGEHGLADHVADRKDMRDVGAHLLVDLYETPLVNRDARGVRANHLAVGPTATSKRSKVSFEFGIYFRRRHLLNDRFARRVQPIAARHSANFSAGVWIEQGLSRPFVELPCDGTELGLAV